MPSQLAGYFLFFFDYFRSSTGAQCLSPSPIFVLALSSSNYSRLSHSHHTCCTTAAIYHTSMTVSQQCAIKFGSGYGAAKTRKTNDTARRPACVDNKVTTNQVPAHPSPQHHRHCSISRGSYAPFDATHAVDKKADGTWSGRRPVFATLQQS